MIPVIFGPPFANRQKLLKKKNIKTDRTLFSSPGFIFKSFLALMNTSLSKSKNLKNWVGVCGTLPKTLTLFQTKICDFPYPISDLIKNLIPYIRPQTLKSGAPNKNINQNHLNKA